jgi:uncharacterized protein YggT (Ycf19 family)
LINYIISALIQGLVWFLIVISWMIFINVLLSWILSHNHPLRALLTRLTRPIIEPFQHISRKFNSSNLPIDFSPFLALLTLSLVAELLKVISSFL